MRFHSENTPLCSLCTATTRSDELLSVVASDADVSALERSDTYRGRYFVLGGTISLASEKTNGLRIKELIASLPAHAAKGLREIILAFPVNPEGDATATRVREELSSIASSHDIKITSLGRGLSTGSELEYADPETLKNALEGRR